MTAKAKKAPPKKKYTGRVHDHGRARVKETTHTSPRTGKLTWQVFYSMDGKMQRPVFDSVRQAKDWIDSQGAQKTVHGDLVTKLSRHELLSATDATVLLKRSGLEISLLEVVEQHITQHKLDLKSWTVSEVYQDLQSEAKNPSDGSDPLRPTSISGRKQYLKDFVEEFGGRKVTSITREEVVEFIDRPHEPPKKPKKAVTIRHYKEKLQLLFNHAEKVMMESGYKNTVAKYPRRKRSQVNKVATPEATEAMLRELEKTNPRVAVGMAIACFSGVRSMEIYRPFDGLRWEWIDLKEGVIYVPQEDAKIRSDRDVPITPNLKAWLMRYWKDEGRITPSKSRFVEAVTAAKRKTGVEWPSNAARKSAGTYFAKLHGDTAGADLLGHTTGTGEFRRSYKGKAKERKNAEKYFAIQPTPKKAGAKLKLVG